MSGYGERTECTQVSSVVERDEAEGDDDEEDGLLVYVPAEKERCIGTECSGRDKVGPGWAEEEFDQGGLERKHGQEIMAL